MNKNFLQFIEDYFEQVNAFMKNTNNIISIMQKQENYTEEKEESANRNLLQELIHYKSLIPKILKDYDIAPEEINTKNLHSKEVKNIVSRLFKNEGIKMPSESISAIIDVFVNRKIDLNSGNLDNFQKTINQYLTDRNINDLYNNAFIIENYDLKLEEDKEKKDFNKIFINVLKNSFKGLKEHQQAEIFSQLTVFIEEYSKTDLGNKHLSLIRDEYIKSFKESKTEEDKENATRNWTLNLLNAYNNSIPLDNNIIIDKDNKEIQYKTSSGGSFDGLFLINTTKIPENKLSEFNEINSVEQFFKFKKNMDTVAQYQISATSDRGFLIEAPSIVRHSLSAYILNKILNIHHIQSKDPYFKDSFNITKSDQKFNSNMTGAIVHAIKKIIPQIENEIKSDSSEDFLISFQKSLNSSPLFFIKLLNNKYIDGFDINYNDKKNKSIELNREDIEKFNSIEENLYEKHGNSDLVFSSKSIMCFYRTHMIYEKNNIEINQSLIKNKNAGKLNTPDLMLLVQFSSIFKSSYYGKDDLEIQIAEEFVNSNIEIKGIGVKQKFNNNLLKKMNIEDIDNIILDTFIYNKNSIDNINKISNNDDMNNLVQSLCIYALYQKEEKKKEILEKLIEYSESSIRLKSALKKDKNFVKIKEVLNFLEEINKSRLEKEKERLEKEKERLEKEKEKVEKEKLLEEKLKAKEKAKENIMTIISMHLPNDVFNVIIQQNIDVIKDFNNNEIKEITNIINKKQSEDSKIWFKNFLSREVIKDYSEEHKKNMNVSDNILKEIEIYSKEVQYNQIKNPIKLKKLLDLIEEKIINSDIKHFVLQGVSNLEDNNLIIDNKIKNKIDSLNFNEKKLNNSYKI